MNLIEFENRVSELMAQIEQMELSDGELSRAMSRNKQPDRANLDSAWIIREAILRVMGKRTAETYVGRYGA
jgi:hypothetical protein